MTHGSLFSGIGGFELGFQWTGIQTVWQVEIDEYAQKVLKLRFPESKIYSDIKTVGAHNLEKVEIISGGFPCQDISVAGKRAGITGKRSGLWSEMFRVCSELRPRFIVIENVANLVRLGLDRVLADLTSIGYDAEWQIISARDVGAHHLRKRIWIIAYPERDGNDRSMEECRVSLCRQNNEGIGSSYWEQFELVTESISPSKWRDEGNGINTRPLLIRNNDGVPNRLDRLKCLGNAVVPQIPYLIGKLLLTKFKSGF